MHIDIQGHLGAVTRGVETREHQGQPVRVIIAARTYDTTVEDLWDAITTAERIPRWFLPVSGDLRPGGRFQLQGNAGGEILRCEPPRHLTVTWEWAGNVSWLEVRLAAEPGGGARLVLEHMAPEDDHWRQFGAGAGGVGWDMALMGLGEHLTGKAAVDPASAGAWMVSDEGRAFMRGSSDSWREASIASGIPPEVARAAAARTLAAYTGEAPEPPAGDEGGSGS
jgi:uncharacterized protein YndB with AHSA1/START domain